MLFLAFPDRRDRAYSFAAFLGLVVALPVALSIFPEDRDVGLAFLLVSTVGPVALGAEPTGHKQQEGDERTPEGLYSINARNPNSSFHLSLQVSYPNEQDRARAVAAGVDPGGLIMIHGLPNGLGWLGSLHRLVDWTDGCIAVTSAEMDEIWESVAIGTPVLIKP